jgi:hypothetical protein
MAQNSPGEIQEKVLEKLVQINKSAAKKFNIPVMDPVILEISETANNHVISQQAEESLIKSPDGDFRRVVSATPGEKKRKDKDGKEDNRPQVSIEDCKKAVESLSGGDGKKFLVSVLKLFDMARTSSKREERLEATKLLSEINISIYDSCEIPIMNPALEELSKISGSKKIRRMAEKNYIEGDDLGVREVH